MSFSHDIVISPSNLVFAMVDLRRFFIIFNFEKLLSVATLPIGNVRHIFKNM